MKKTIHGFQIIVHQKRCNFLRFIFNYLKGRVTETVGETKRGTCWLIPQMAEMVGVGLVGSQELLNLPHKCRYWAILCCFARPLESWMKSRVTRTQTYAHIDVNTCRVRISQLSYHASPIKEAILE